MRKWLRNTLAATLLITAMTTAVWLVMPGPTDPVYKGQRLSVWLSGIWSEEADEAVRHIGTNAIPTLLNLLQARDSKLKLRLISLSTRQHLIKFNYVTASDRHTEALLAFRALKASASNAVPELIRMYNPGNSSESQTAILSSLGFIGPPAKSAIPLLLQVVATNTDNLVMKTGFVALGSIGSAPEIVIPAMTKLLHDPRADVRRFAVRTLGDYGSDARLATSEVLESLEDVDSLVRDQALGSLCQVYGKPEWKVIRRSFPLSAQKFSSFDLIRVINGLGAMGTNAAPAVPALVKFLADPNDDIRVSATNALKSIDRTAAANAGVR